MIRGYAVQDGRLREVGSALEQPESIVWFDVASPELAEEKALEAVLGINVPTREDMEEIEDSSRLYLEDGAAFMTASLPTRAGTPDAAMTPVTFILLGDRLITVRYGEPKAFATFPLRAEKVALGCTGGRTVLLALLDAVVDRLADLLEAAGREIEATSRGVFKPLEKGARPPDYRGVLNGIGQHGDLISNVTESLVTLERVVAYMTLVASRTGMSKEDRARLKSLSRDARFLTDHASSMSQKVTFLLDATLGMISIEQNGIIKIFSVAAVLFLPPTLIASIYGMNFKAMPELGMSLGYPLALGLMVLSAGVSLWFFKRRGWL